MILMERQKNTAKPGTGPFIQELAHLLIRLFAGSDEFSAGGNGWHEAFWSTWICGFDDKAHPLTPNSIEIDALEHDIGGWSSAGHNGLSFGVSRLRRGCYGGRVLRPDQPFRPWKRGKSEAGSGKSRSAWQGEPPSVGCGGEGARRIQLQTPVETRLTTVPLMVWISRHGRNI